MLKVLTGSQQGYIIKIVRRKGKARQGGVFDNGSGIQAPKAGASRGRRCEPNHLTRGATTNSKPGARKLQGPATAKGAKTGGEQKGACKRRREGTLYNEPGNTGAKIQPCSA